MAKVKLGEICDILNGYAFKSSLYQDSGIRIIRITNVQNGFIEDKEPKYYGLDKENEIQKYMLQENDLLISLTGNVGRVGLITKDLLPAALNQRVACLRLKDKCDVDIKYIYNALNNSIFEQKCILNAKGIAQMNLSTAWLKEYEIDVPLKAIQNEISSKLDKIQQIIDIRKKQIHELDELIKSQFVQMFGNPIINDKDMNYIAMTSVCEIIDGDRGKNYPKAEELFENEYCLFLNAKNVTNSGFSFENCMYITEEKDKKLRNGKLKRGDVVLTTRGTVGNLAFYTDEIPFENVRINSGMVILRMKKDVVNEIFFIEQFKMQLDNIKNKIANGSAQPQLPIAKMNGIKVLTPDIELQNQFAEFVRLIDKEKFELQKSLENIQKTKEVLINKYF